MRAAWALVVFVFFLFQWKNVSLYYSDTGIITPDTAHEIFRSTYWFTVFSFVQSPEAVWNLYLFFLGALFLMMLGIFPRLTTVISVLLLFSFHERNTLILGGGDTLLRNIGFILMIAPSIDAFSVKRWMMQKMSFTKTKSLLPPLTMPQWPYRLLLWQMIVLYGTSLWYKLLGSMWIRGTAVQVTLHHPFFVRFNPSHLNFLMPLAPLIDWLSLLFEVLWIFLLFPRWLTDLLPPQLPRFPLKRILLIAGLFFHGGILILMDAGSFSLAIFVAYLGLLREDDIEWITSVFPHLKKLPERTMRSVFKK